MYRFQITPDNDILNEPSHITQRDNNHLKSKQFSPPIDNIWKII